MHKSFNRINTCCDKLVYEMNAQDHKADRYPDVDLKHILANWFSFLIEGLSVIIGISSLNHNATRIRDTTNLQFS